MSDSIALKTIKQRDIPILIEMAHDVFPTTYQEILSKEQITYMLDFMYHPQKIQQQLNDGILYFFIENQHTKIGYSSVELNYKGTTTLYIHKIYLLQANQRKGYGKKVIQKIVTLAKDNKQQAIMLNVNRFNTALDFYQSIGFIIVKKEDIHIGNDFFMNDYVLKKEVSNIY